MKILIVDDQPMMLKTLEIKFAKEGFEVFTTTSGIKAKEILDVENIDVVLTEVGFSDVADFEILKSAKTKDYNIVVIIISIHSTEQVIINAFENGAEEYLIKPINLNLLSVRIKKLLKVKKMREVLAKSIPPTERQNILQQLSRLEFFAPSTDPVTKTSDTQVTSPPLSGSALLRSSHNNFPTGNSYEPVIFNAPVSEPIIEKSSFPENNEQGESENAGGLENILEANHMGGFENDTEVEIEPEAAHDREVGNEVGVENDVPDSQIEHKSFFSVVRDKLITSFKEFLPYFLISTGFFLLARFFEIASDCYLHGTTQLLGATIFDGLVKDLLFCFQTGFILYILFFLLSFINRRLAKIFFIIVTIVLLVIQISLSQYFLTALVPLGADLWNYSFADIKQTVQASGGITFAMITVFLVAVALIILSFRFLPKKLKPNTPFAVILGVIFIISLFIDNSYANKSLMPGKEYSNNLSLNKSWYFYSSSWMHFFPTSKNERYNTANSKIETDALKNGSDASPSFRYVDEQHFPFLHMLDTNRNVLSPFFDSSKSAPNIVIILVEGLGRAFTNKNAYLGNFTPFLDSLSAQSLYWENFLSEGGRTFAVLPSVIGSLPFNKTGFNEMADHMSPHISLLSILKRNGYNTSFYYGGDAHFDNMDIYLKKNEVNNIYDQNTFSSSYIKMPASTSGFSWGYGDKELFRKYFESKQNTAAPFASILLTVSTHSPFIVNDESLYQQRFETRLDELKFDELKKTEARNYKSQYASILFMDDAVKGFINQYKQRPDFNNTIFIITGDHRMPEIPMSTKIDRYHVPLIIYSPLLKRSATFSSVSTHFDITPSLSVLLHKTYGLRIPEMTQWMGDGLDTNRAFRNVHSYPFKQTKNEGINDFMLGEYLLNENNLFHIYKTMDIEPESNPAKVSEINSAMDYFKRKNEQFIQTGKLIPDSLANKWGSK